MDMDKCMGINAFMRVCKWRVCRGGCVGEEVGVVCYRCECGEGVQKACPHRGLPDSS